MATPGLTTLKSLKAYVLSSGPAAAGPGPDDVLLSRLIKAVTAYILNYLQRDSLAVQSVLETYDGYGGRQLVLRRFPVIAITSVAMVGQNITQAAIGNPRCNGVFLEPAPASGGEQKIVLFGYCFPRGPALIDVTYTSGYQTQEAFIPEAGALVFSPSDTWLQDDGVVFTASAVPLVKVASNPGAGQYAVATAIDGSITYVFAPADIAAPMLVTYSYVPDDIEQAAIELVGDWFKRKDRIGQTSVHSATGMTVSFEKRDMTSSVASMLQPYKRVVPV